MAALADLHVELLTLVRAAPAPPGPLASPSPGRAARGVCPAPLETGSPPSSPVGTPRRSPASPARICSQLSWRARQSETAETMARFLLSDAEAMRRRALASQAAAEHWHRVSQAAFISQLEVALRQATRQSEEDEWRDLQQRREQALGGRACDHRHTA